jgi:hypothetical protein
LARAVEFEVPGAAAHDKKNMSKYVLEITKEVYGVDIDLSGVDLQNYYRADGAKVTKSLSSLLRQQVTKEEVQSRFASYAKRVSELYTTGLSLRAEFGDKSMIGEGLYEAAKTCLRSDGENATSKHFMAKNRRCGVIVLYQKGKKEPGGRCLCYFAGNRNIYLTNFYWRHIPQNKLYFITAVRHLLGIPKVLYRQNPKFFLPIFRNGDSILVYDERTKPIIPNKRLSCPHCGTSVPEGELYMEEMSSYRIIGCTQECARKNSKLFTQCAGCGEHVLSPTAASVANRRYCPRCVKTRVLNCVICGSGGFKEDMKEIEGSPVCKNCLKKAKCMVCGDIITDSSTYKKIGDLHCCNKCLMKSGHVCSVCRTTSTKKIPLKRIGGMRIPICEDCASPLPGTIMEAQGKLAEAR